MEKNHVVEKVSESICWWIGNRRKKFSELSHETMAVNPFLAPALLALGDISSFDELAHLLLAGHSSTGHATGFGKLIDEKVLPHAFGTMKLTADYRKTGGWSASMFDEIDHIVKRQDGSISLLSLKAGRWTIQLTMAVQLNHSFVELLAARAAGKVNFNDIAVGVFYGTNETLTDKYDIIRGINRGKAHNVVDVRSDVNIYAGRAFWSWLNDGQDQTQEWLMEGVLCGIQEAKAKHGPMGNLIHNYKDAFSKQFKSHIASDGTIDWMGILKMING